ncbi:MAG: hypothetical protein RIR96_867 [Bacteroidota bacterium]|jgi:predicted membrane protein
MKLIGLIAELFVIYILFKLVFEFILPLYRASKQMNQKMQEFQQQNHQKQNPEPGFENKSNVNNTSKDYIDFEEIKS